MYEIYSRIERLSEKIRLLADTNNSYRDHFDTKVRQDNLRYNLSWLISKVLVNAESPKEITVEQFTEYLHRFNESNLSDLALKDFVDLGWIRKINGEFCLPSLVSRILWRIQNRENVEIPKEYELYINCLSEFHSKNLESQKSLKINASLLASLLSEQETNLLIEKEILTSKEESGEFYAIDCKENICRYLRNEISSTTWLLLKNDAAYATDKAKFLRFIEIVKTWLYYWPDNLKAFLSNEDLTKIVHEAVSLLLSEEDLVDNGKEFHKSWMDQPRYAHYDLFYPIPTITVQFSTPIDGLQTIKRLERYYQGVFDHSHVRSFYHLLLRIIIENDQAYGEAGRRYPNVIALMKDIRRPYLISEIYFELKNTKPEIFPYFLLHHELAPVVFIGFEEIQFSDKSVSKNDRLDKYRAVKAQVTEMWKEAYEIITSTLITFSSKEEFANALSQILFFQVEQFFYNKGGQYQNTVDHLEAKARFEFAITKLGEIKSQFASSSGLKVRLFPNYLRQIFEFLKSKKTKNYYEFISLPCSQLELATQILKLGNTTFFQGEISEHQRQDLEKLKVETSQYLFQVLVAFFASDTIEKYDFHTGNAQIVKLKRGISHFGFEIIEWGYIFIHLEQSNLLRTFTEDFSSTIVFETASDQGKYHDQNKEQFDKLRLFIKAVGLSILQINREYIEFETVSKRVAEVKEYLYGILQTMSVRYAVDDLHNNRINIFDDRYSSFEYNLYNQEIADIIFTCFNQSANIEQETFLNSFFDDTSDLDLLLNAYNTFESGKSRAILSAKIQSINIQEFIRSKHTVSQLESSIIEAVNSDSYFSFALPILEKVEAHIEKVQLRTREYQSFFFSIKLLLAFKSKNLKEIEELSTPQDNPGSTGHNIEAENKRSYFIGLHELYNEKKLDHAIVIFQRLISNQPDDYEVRYRLFHANVLKYSATNELSRIILELNEWNEYIQNLGADKKKQATIENNIAYTSVIAYAAVKDYNAFDKLIDHLPKAFLFDEEIIPVIFQVYVDRHLYEIAIPYLSNATKFYSEMEKEPPHLIRKLLTTVDDSKRVTRLRSAFSEIISLDMVKLLATIPEKFNGKRQIGEFLLNEIVRAGKLMMQKIKSLSDISYENKYNDLLLAILQFRISIWGLEIGDQARSGSSVSGIDLGELDFVVKYAGDSLALIEAMILIGKNQPKTEEHILKIEKYLPDAKLFYVLTYYKGPSDKFNATWESYKRDVLEVSYPESYSLISTTVNDVVVSVDVRKIKVGLTEHIDGIKVFHLFFNISGTI